MGFQHILNRFATHLQRVGKVFATHSQNICDGSATHLQTICNAFATHLHHICNVLATHLQCICNTLAMLSQCVVTLSVPKSEQCYNRNVKLQWSPTLMPNAYHLAHKKRGTLQIDIIYLKNLIKI